MEIGPAAKLNLLMGGKLLLLAILSLNCVASEPPSPVWKKSSPIPDETGVAGAFAGSLGGALILAGGANFPDKMPWEGGKKVWHNTIYKFERANGRWEKAGHLPRPLGYGVTISHGGSPICIGGSDANRHYADAFRVRLEAGQLQFEPLPTLPIALANMSGALASGVIYIAGGTEEPGEKEASNRLFSLSLEASPLRWRELDPLPGRPRFLSTAAARDGSFYLFGGVALDKSPDGKSSRVYLKETWAYSPARGWIRKADMPIPLAASPSPAPVVDGHALILGGDDGTRVSFQPLEKHPGFNKTILAYNFATDRWSAVEQAPVSRVTTPCVEWRGWFVIPSGEARPGVRSPEVWMLTPR